MYAVAARLESANWHVLSSLEEEEDEKIKEQNGDKASCASEKPFSTRWCSKASRVPRDLETLLLMSQGDGMIFLFFFL